MLAERRRRPLRRTICEPPEGADLANLAAKARYVGSPEHKNYPSFAGRTPHPRPDATKCNPALGDQETLTSWLREAIAQGSVGAPWEGDYPRYVWYRNKDVVYEGRLVNQELGEYKGYPLSPDEHPKGVE